MMMPKSGIRRTALAIGAMLSTAVVLSGLTWATADDDNPFRRPDAPKGERPPAPPLEGDRERPPAPPREGDREHADRVRPGGPGGEFSPPFGQFDPRAVREIMEKIEKAARDGKPDEVQELLAELRRRLPQPPPFPPREGDRPGERGPGPRDGERGPGPRDGERGPGPRDGERGPGPRDGERGPGPREGERGPGPREGERGPGPRDEGKAAHAVKAIATEVMVTADPDRGMAIVAHGRATAIRTSEKSVANRHSA